MNRRIRAPLAWLAIGASASAGAQVAETPVQGAGTSAFVSDDSEGFLTRRLALEYLPLFRYRDGLTGVRYTASRYQADGWTGFGQRLSAVHRRVDPLTGDGWQVEGGLSRQEGHDLLSAEATYHATFAGARSVELFLSRDWVETRLALDNGISFTFAGAALEQGFGPHVTLVGVAGYQDFSDGNYRRHGRARLIVQPDLDIGLTLQARYRMYTSASTALAGTYFNPDRYDEAMLAVGWRKRMQGWMASLTAGLGRQRVADASRTPTRLLEVAFETTPARSQSIRLRAGLNKSASFGGPDYSYRYAQVEWLLGF